MDSKEEVASDGEVPQKKGFLRLRSANHNEDTCNSIAEDYRNGKFTDFVFLCGDDASQVMQAHRLLLSKASDYFRKVIEAASNISFGYPIIPMIALKEVPNSDLKAIIDFIYEGKITIPKKQLNSVVKTAQFLQVNGLQHLGDEKARSASPRSENNFSQDSNALSEMKPTVYVPKMDPSLIPKLDNRDSTQITLSTPDVVISRSQTAPPAVNATNAVITKHSTSLLVNRPPPIRPKPPNTLTDSNLTMNRMTASEPKVNTQLFSLLKPGVLPKVDYTPNNLADFAKQVNCYPSQSPNERKTFLLNATTTNPSIIYPHYTLKLLSGNVSHHNVQATVMNPLPHEVKFLPNTTILRTPTTTKTTNSVPHCVTSVSLTNSSEKPVQVRVELRPKPLRQNEPSSIISKSCVQKPSHLPEKKETVPVLDDKQKASCVKGDTDTSKSVANTTTDCEKKNLSETPVEAQASSSSPKDIEARALSSSKTSPEIVDDELPGVVFGPASCTEEDLPPKDKSTVTPTLIRAMARKCTTPFVNRRKLLIEHLMKQPPSKRHKPEMESSVDKNVMEVDAFNSEVNSLKLNKTSPNKNSSNATISGTAESSHNEDFKEPEEIWLDL